MRKPDFLGIGAQKAATSWIHACLYEHPQVFMPTDKEIHYFSRHYSKGLPWYENHFRNCRTDQLAGEFSPTYLYDAETPSRIYDYVPHVKFIACLRNPIDRAISAYRYGIKMGTVPTNETFLDAVVKRPGYLEHGLYQEQIASYLKFFDKNQILILLYEDIRDDPCRFMQNVYRFLGVDADFRPSMALRVVNVGSGAARIPLLDRIMRDVASKLRKAGLGHIVWRLARSRLMESLVKINKLPEVQTTLTAEERAKLERTFVKDVKALEQLLERDLVKLWLLHS
jgi:hypothetical protein